MESVIEIINFLNNDFFSVPQEEPTAILTELASQ